MDEFEKLLTNKTKLVAITECSNVLGTIVPLKKLMKKAHSIGALVLVDRCKGSCMGKLMFKTWIAIFMVLPVIKFMGQAALVYFMPKQIF